MRFTIVKNTSTSQPPQQSHDFLPPGGTIGRSADNNWCLPDEDLVIARLQAIVSISADGECRINNQGSASDILLNMIPLAPDRQVEIRDGDVLNIGKYQIQIIDVKKSSPSRAADLTNSDQQQPNANKSRIPNEVWDDLEQILTTSNPSSPSDLHQAAPNTQRLNDNHPLVREQQHKERNPIDPLAQMETTTVLETLQLRATDPIAMFDSDTTFQRENILNDHTPTTLLQRNEPDGNQDEDKKEVDPLTLFDDEQISPRQHAKNNDDPLNMLLDNAAPLNSLDGTTTSDVSEPQFIPESDPVPTYTKTQLFTSETSSPPLFEQEKPKQETTKAQIKNPIEEILHNHQDTSHHQNTFHHQNNESILEGKLLAALLDGMGLKDFHRVQFDEHHMYQLGQLVSQLSQGIVVLNASRNLLKRKADADIPQMQSEANNPFKLLPSGQSILALIFGGHMPGFMPLEQATCDVLIELQAHQLGMIAGIRANVTDILQLFHPVLLEQKAQSEGCLPRLSLSSTYKASMWDYLIKYYQTTASELEQDSVLFGEGFLQAYEAEVNRYKDFQDRAQK